MTARAVGVAERDDGVLGGCVATNETGWLLLFVRRIAVDPQSYGVLGGFVLFVLGTGDTCFR
jgi:hypothetical protein